jgi:hypothetical protein
VSVRKFDGELQRKTIARSDAPSTDRAKCNLLFLDDSDGWLKA